jgi:predicted ATPase
LIGENSGGKSSLLKLLLALKQTLESPTEVNLKLTGDYTDLGNFEEVVYHRKKNRKITIEFESSTVYFDYFLDFLNLLETSPTKAKLNAIKQIIDGYKDSTTKVTFDFSSKLSDHSSIKTVFHNSKIGTLTLTNKKTKEVNSIRGLLCDVKFDFKEYSAVIENSVAYKEGFLTLFDRDIKSWCDKFDANNGDHLYYTIVYLLAFQNYIQFQIEKIRFVNPIGNSPKRFYFQEDRKTTYKQIDIEKFINVLSDKSLSEKQYQDRISSLNEIIKRFGIAEEITIIKDKLLPVVALNVKTKDFWSNITDVGYGVSLQIPILFQAILSENTKHGHTLLIEQPEVHLHPALQAKFIDTLLSIGTKNTYIIETHSEHIIRKLQVLVKQGMYGLKPDDINIYYFKREDVKFDVSHHKISLDGRLSPQFPNGFFDASYNLVKQLL